MTQTVELYSEGFTGASCEQLLRHVYVEWMNNYLSVEKFAEHHQMSVEDADQLIKLSCKVMKQHGEAQQ